MTGTLSQSAIYQQALIEHERIQDQFVPVYIIGEDIEINHEANTDDIPSADALFILLVCILGLMLGLGLIGIIAMRFSAG